MENTSLALSRQIEIVSGPRAVVSRDQSNESKQTDCDKAESCPEEAVSIFESGNLFAFAFKNTATSTVSCTQIVSGRERTDAVRVTFDLGNGRRIVSVLQCRFCSATSIESAVAITPSHAAIFFWLKVSCIEYRLIMAPRRGHAIDVARVGEGTVRLPRRALIVSGDGGQRVPAVFRE